MRSLARVLPGVSRCRRFWCVTMRREVELEDFGLDAMDAQESRDPYDIFLLMQNVQRAEQEAAREAELLAVLLIVWSASVTASANSYNASYRPAPLPGSGSTLVAGWASSRSARKRRR